MKKPTLKSKASVFCDIDWKGRIGRREQEFPPTPWPYLPSFNWSLVGKLNEAPREELLKAIRSALSQWTGVIQIKCKETNKAEEDSTTNLRIKICSPGDRFPDKRPGVLGHAYVGGANCSIYNLKPAGRCGEIVINDTGSVVDKLDIHTFHNLILHEFGHVIGLHHWVGEERSVMAPKMSVALYTGALRLSDIDIQNIRAAYKNSGKVPPKSTPAAKDTGPPVVFAFRSPGRVVVLRNKKVVGSMAPSFFVKEYRGKKVIEEGSNKAFTVCGTDMPQNSKLVPFCK
ncbi:hypothetical protein TWF694_002907 [Orbilia ellipsospora]|uniref:Peptidase metallopeptidase domain-containing protein n=1 Tax=Orbilia ellipsospora TaxID=2528407 RepID=A0AAV9X2K9_9PEZI